MVRQMDEEGFGPCSNEAECQAVCPKGIKMSNIARMVREYTRAALVGGS
jgi:succinate dehydrogenase / fumarate reductase iron-sulfur subunit